MAHEVYSHDSGSVWNKKCNSIKLPDELTRPMSCLCSLIYGLKDGMASFMAWQYLIIQSLQLSTSLMVTLSAALLVIGGDEHQTK